MNDLLSTDWRTYASRACGRSPAIDAIGAILDDPQLSNEGRTLVELAMRAQVTGTMPDISGIKDICANRHRGNPESEDAFRRVGMHLTEGRAAVLEAIRRAPRGATCKEVAASFLVEMHTLSGRFSELKRAGLIRPTGEKRDGCAVMISV